MSFNALEHRLIKTLKVRTEEEGPLSTLMLSCSGGLDSMALWEVLENLSPVFKYELKILHIHHGGKSSYRKEALEFCRSQALERGLEFLEETSEKELKSEEELRDFRKEVYQKYSSPKVLICLAQHQDDLVETLVLRLIRGTGLEGLKAPFSDPGLFRPFLKTATRKDLEDYVEEKKIRYIEDPSNKNQAYLRNWIRQDWLKSLEKRHGSSAFKRSLLQLSLNLSSQDSEKGSFSVEFYKKLNLHEYVVDLSILSSMSQYQKKASIAKLLFEIKKSDYTSGQVEEVLKRLDSSQKRLEFRVSALCWTKDGNRLFVRSFEAL